MVAIVLLFQKLIDSNINQVQILKNRKSNTEQLKNKSSAKNQKNNPISINFFILNQFFKNIFNPSPERTNFNPRFL